MSIPDELRVLDRAIALDRVGGDEELLREIAALFLEECPVMLSAAREAVEQSDARKLERAAHAFRGSAANLGAERARAAAHELEMMGRSGSMEHAQQTFLALEREVEALKPELLAVSVAA